jgi:hypothetical protein
MPAVTSSGFCRSHGDLHRHKSPVEEDLYGIMLSLTGDSGLDVHVALQKVFLAFSGNRITARRASVFGYLAQLILLSAPQSDGANDAPSFKLKSAPSSKPIDEATIQALLGKLREKFPPNPERPPLPPGRNHNLRS